MSERVILRFYAELTDHLPAAGTEVARLVEAEEEVGALIESCGVPLAEVDLIVVDGDSVGPHHRVGPGDRIGVYPVFESFDIGPEARLANRPLRVTRFLVDADLEPLARLLRRCGYDTRVSHDPLSGHLDPAPDEGRIVLTRHPEVVAGSGVTHGLVVRAVEPADQLAEVARRLHLSVP